MQGNSCQGTGIMYAGDDDPDEAVEIFNQVLVKS